MPKFILKESHENGKDGTLRLHGCRTESCWLCNTYQDNLHWLSIYYLCQTF